MKLLLALALIISVPVNATSTDDVIYRMTGQQTSCEVLKDKPESRGFKLAKKQDPTITALKRTRAELVSRNPNDKLIKVIDKALNARLVQ